MRSLGLGLGLALVLACPLAASAKDDEARVHGPSGGDDTPMLQQAIDLTKSGGRLFIPVGHYTLQGTLVVNKPITIIGTGLGAQLYETGNQTLFRFTNVNGAAMRDLYLGSNATLAGASLIELVNSHHNEIQNVTMLGGYYGLHLLGSLLNTVIDLRSGVNFGGFFAPVSTNQVWVMGEPFNGISPNANTFIGPALEGGTNGIVLADPTHQTSIQIFGGSIEGVSGVGVTFRGAFLPSSITGVDFEANGQDIVVSASSNIKIAAINSVNTSPGALPQIAISGDSRNVQISDSVIESLSVTAAAKRVLLQNVTFGTAFCPSSLLNLPAPAAYTATIGAVPDAIANITAANVGNYCGGQ